MKEYPLVNGRIIPLDGMKAEIERRLGMLMLLPDDPQQPDCNWTELAMALALRTALHRCYEAIEAAEDTDLHPSIKSIYRAQATLALAIAACITEQLDQLPVDLAADLEDRWIAARKANHAKDADRPTRGLATQARNPEQAAPPDQNGH